MNVALAVKKLRQLGYRFQAQGRRMRYEWQGQGKPDPAEVIPLLDVVRQHREEVKELLALVSCQTCNHAQVGQGWAICQREPWDGIKGQAPDYFHKCENFTPRTKPLPPPKEIRLCAECPWYQQNPWTHYPEFPAWCAYHFDHLTADNPACINYRKGDA